jgi:hypothetical protein
LRGDISYEPRKTPITRKWKSNEELDKLGWAGAELAARPKGDARKIRIARRLRAETAVTLKWIATELHMGTWTHVANRLQTTKGKHDTNNQAEFGLV